MALLSRQPWPVATGLLVPLLTLASPGWLKLDGVPPAWSVIWLLPWALSEGRRAGSAAGLGLGLLLDGLHPGSVSLVPGLTLLGWWWGRMGRKAPPIQRSFSLGLLALVGTALLNLSLMLQWALLCWRQVASLQGSVELLTGGAEALRQAGPQAALLALPLGRWEDLSQIGLQVLLAQTLLTALLAPMLCSLQLIFWRQLGAGWRGSSV
ncbi:MAG: rod shape-determining protein MreD [Cyanobium sp.]